LKIRFNYWRFVGRQGAGRGCSAGAEENDCDEGRENGQSEAAKFSVGQGRSPANLLTLIHKPATNFSTADFADSTDQSRLLWVRRIGCDLEGQRMWLL
jgi:hypothetical protein